MTTSTQLLAGLGALLSAIFVKAPYISVWFQQLTPGQKQATVILSTAGMAVLFYVVGRYTGATAEPWDVVFNWLAAWAASQLTHYGTAKMWTPPGQ